MPNMVISGVTFSYTFPAGVSNANDVHIVVTTALEYNPAWYNTCTVEFSGKPDDTGTFYNIPLEITRVGLLLEESYSAGDTVSGRIRVEGTPAPIASATITYSGTRRYLTCQGRPLSTAYGQLYTID